MGAFPTVLLAIVLIFAAGLIKLVIALMRKILLRQKSESRSCPRFPRFILLVLAAQGIRNVRSVLQKGAFFAAVEHSNADKIERCLMRGANLNELKTFTVNYCRRTHTPPVVHVLFEQSRRCQAAYRARCRCQSRCRLKQSYAAHVRLTKQ